MDCSARRVDDLDQQAWVVVEMSMTNCRGKLLAVLDRFNVKRKADLEAVESAVAGFHIEEVRFQHSTSYGRRQRPRLLTSLSR